MNKDLFAELEQSLNEMVEHTAGKRRLRTTTRILPPKKYTRDDIIEIRKKCHFSQASFASGLNVSTKTVQAWEQGLREPDGAALKLLSIAELHPEVIFGSK
jgi:putative transcriptional regulator